MTITAAHMLAKVREADKSFDPDKFNLGFHPAVTKTLTTFKPYVLLSHYGFTDPTKMELSLFGRKPRRHVAKLRCLHKCRVAKCPGHAINLRHAVCTNDGCSKQVTLH